MNEEYEASRLGTGGGDGAASVDQPPHGDPVDGRNDRTTTGDREGEVVSLDKFRKH